MSCDCPDPMDCCTPCPPSPDPIMPRCDIVLVDGVFTNAVVTVEEGCISNVASGRPPQYSPAVCCDDDCGGGGGDGERGPQGFPGEDGENATITVGAVNTIDPEDPAQVINVGTNTNAVFDFYIPAGKEGASGESGSGLDSDEAGIRFQNGLLTSLPASWPPAMAFVATANPSEVSIEISQPNSQNGLVELSLDLSLFREDIEGWVEERLLEELDPVRDRIDILESKVASLEARVTDLENQNP